MRTLSKKGFNDPGKIMWVLVLVLFFTSIIGTLATNVANPNENVTGASLILYGLITLVVVAGFIISLLKMTGMKGGR